MSFRAQSGRRKDETRSLLQVIHRITGLLRVEDYREGVLLGLLFSIGGVDAPLAEAASQALCEQVQTGRFTWNKTHKS